MKKLPETKRMAEAFLSARNRIRALFSASAPRASAHDFFRRLTPNFSSPQPQRRPFTTQLGEPGLRRVRYVIFPLRAAVALPLQRNGLDRRIGRRICVTGESHRTQSRLHSW